MPDHQAFFDLLDVLEREDDLEPERFFGLMQARFRLKHILYASAERSLSGWRNRVVHHTPSTCIEVEVVDGLLDLVSTSVRPLDWPTAASPGTPSLSMPGAVLPLAAPARRVAFLGVWVDIPGERWRHYRRCHLRDFHLLASLFHAGLTERAASRRDTSHLDVLTRRETEVLSWAAAGKSYWEIGAILGISERTVRFFMTNARRKLDVVSNAQAVARAMRRDLLPAE